MDKIKAYFIEGIIFSNTKEAITLNQKSSFGEKNTKDKITYTLTETLYLVDKNKMEVFSKTKKIYEEELLSKFKRYDKNIHSKFIVFKNLRDKGYIVKTAVKFGADFRVYEKKISQHAKWLVTIHKASEKISWQDFSAKNRVAHSTKKNLLIAIIDDEEDITYYEIAWIKP